MRTSQFTAKKTFWISIGALIFIAGCAMVPVPTRSIHTGRSDQWGKCADLFITLDKQVTQSQAIESYPFRVQGYPYLRVNRFLASFANDKKDPAALEDWVNRMQALDLEARKFELSNLIPADIPGSDADTDTNSVLGRVIACGDLLKKVDSPGYSEQLPKAATAPDDYIQLRRIFGLYPLTRLFISAGVASWHTEARNTFSNTPPRNWRARRYTPGPVQSVRSIEKIVPDARRDSLGIPDYDSSDRDALFRFYAPVWEIQQQGPADQIGEPYWTADGKLAVDTGSHMTYRLLSFTRFEDRILTQLNYFIWFPARPKTHPFDILGGFLDGLIYRVTLDEDSTPLLYETVHSCGCYYKAYPTGKLEALVNIDYREPPLILSAPQLDHLKEVMTVAVEMRTHYVRYLYPAARPSRGADVDNGYALADYGRLRSLPTANGGRKSMFGQDSIAPGTDRLERFILWPTGVLSPGAMRQWGRHAVAFAGKRHFDDPFYMDKMFRMK